MDKITKFFGIDISKDVFDVCTPNGKHHQFGNDKGGYQKLSKLLDTSSQCVMEATGSYHHHLATWLWTKGYRVSVVNPLVIKRFAQMRLRIAKTDKADAQIIRAYSEVERPQLWTPPPGYVTQAFELNGCVELLIKQRTALKNKLHSVSHKSMGKSLVSRTINKLIKNLDQEILSLESKMEALIREHEGVMLENLCSIPGIGKKTALFLIVVTRGFTGFENSKQLSSYLGLAPILRISGSSVRGQSRISKTGNGSIRNLLFMCSFTACIHNKTCRELYQRIVEKGKSKKLALIAVTNKLLKQAFAIATTQVDYQENYCSVNPMMVR